MLLSAGLLAVLVVLLVPLPPMLLDMLLAFNLGASVLLLLITMSAKRPLDVSVFPSLLLLMTLYRLSLNVATTRLILLSGDAGKIVETFGGFVVGGNLIVGLVIFAILILIQFVVITKGSSRISEVNARFTLDAMPGKQMAIDAELNSGTIDPPEAKRRRDLLTREAEFYGAMDGAGKYVRGDAIAGLLITAINLVGGVILGLMAGMPLAEAFQRYSILTVGDGLVSQIPALIIATTAGILVTKAASEVSLGHEIGSQLLENRRPLMIGAVIMLIVALTPGLPKLPFILLSGGLFAYLRQAKAQDLKKIAAAAPSAGSEAADQPHLREEEQLAEFLNTDRVTLEVGAALAPLVEPKGAKGLRQRITGMRRDLTRKHGLWIPVVRIRDNVNQESTAYRVLLSGREVARGHLRPEMYLAIDPGKTTLAVEGEETTDPTFGLPAKWIPAASRHRAKMGGFTVVDAPSVLITHLGETLRRFAHELLSREDLQKMLNKVRETSPTVVDEIKPDLIRMGVVHQTLIRLLQERVPITNLPVILESLVHHASQVKDPLHLTERIRDDIGRTICDRFRDDRGRVRVIVIEPRLEMAMRDTIQENKLGLKPGQLERLMTLLSNEWQKSTIQNRPLAVLTDRLLRWPLRHAIERGLPDLAIIAYTEIPVDMMIEPVSMLRHEDVMDAGRPTTDGKPSDSTKSASLLDALKSSAA